MDRIKTKTIAEIYLRQGHLQEAYEVLKSLAERDPADREVAERLKTLGEKLGLLTPAPPSETHPTKETLQALQKWLANIQTRRMK